METGDYTAVQPSVGTCHVWQMGRLHYCSTAEPQEDELGLYCGICRHYVDADGSHPVVSMHLAMTS